MPTDTVNDATPEGAEAAGVSLIQAVGSERLPFPPRRKLLRVRLPKPFRKPLRQADRKLIKLVEALAANPISRRRASIVGAVAINAALLFVLAVYGRVHIFVPYKPADSISVVYVDLPASPPVVDLRDPEIEPEPAPVTPEVKPEPEPLPVPEPVRAVEPPPEPEPAPKPEPDSDPIIDLTPNPVFASPSTIEEAPLIPDAPSGEGAPTAEAPLPGDLAVAGEQAPASNDEPLLTVEPQERQAETDAGAEDEDDERPGSGELAAGEQETAEQAPVIAESPTPEKLTPSGDDMFDEEPMFNGRRMALPSVDLPKGDKATNPGTSGVVAIYCPEEFIDKEKIAECAGRPEIRSGWRPGSSGEDYSKAVAVLKDRRRHGDFSNDNVTFGPELARQAEERRRQEDIKDQRASQRDLHGSGVGGSDPAAGTRPDFSKPGAEPGWTRRDDPLVDEKDVEKLRKDLEAAEKRKSPQ